MALFPHTLLVRRNGEVWDDRSQETPRQLGVVKKVGTKWTATSSITSAEEPGFRVRWDCLWWLIEQLEEA